VHLFAGGGHFQRDGLAARGQNDGLGGVNSPQETGPITGVAMEAMINAISVPVRKPYPGEVPAQNPAMRMAEAMRDLGSSSRARARPWAMATKMITRHMMSGSKKAMNMPVSIRAMTVLLYVAPTASISRKASRRVSPVCSRASPRTRAAKQSQGRKELQGA
jgi:hypothetical protein